MIRGIIFDLDGVLLHTDEYHFAAWSRVAGLIGVPFDRTINERLRGVGRRESLDILLEGFNGRPLSEGEKAALCDKKNDFYRQYLAGLSPDDVPAETRDVLKELRMRGFRLAVGSSSRNARLILEKSQLLTAFDAVSDGDDVYRAKPAPDVFIHAAALLRLGVAECAVVEDAPAGITAAKTGGMTAVAFGEAARFRGVEPDYLIPALDALKTLDFVTAMPLSQEGPKHRNYF